jgi:hypothetical protein
MSKTRHNLTQYHARLSQNLNDDIVKFIFIYFAIVNTWRSFLSQKVSVGGGMVKDCSGSSDAFGSDGRCQKNSSSHAGIFMPPYMIYFLTK